MPVSLLFRAVTHCLRTSSSVAFELVRLAALAIRSHNSLAAENLFLRKQMALFRSSRSARSNHVVLTMPLAG